MTATATAAATATATAAAPLFTDVPAVRVTADQATVDLVAQARVAALDALQAVMEDPVTQEVLDLVHDGYTLLRRAHNLVAGVDPRDPSSPEQ